MAENGKKWLDMAGNGLLEMMDLDGLAGFRLKGFKKNSWKWIEMAGNVSNGWKLLELAGHTLKEL